MVNKEERSSKDEVKVEGRLGNEHTHKDGTKGRDAYAAKVSYRDGKNIDERNAKWGHVHYDDEEEKEEDN